MADRDVYERLLADLTHKLHWNEAELSSYKLSLAAREASPAIEAAFQESRSPTGQALRRRRSTDGCESFVEWGEDLACSVEELARLADDKTSWSRLP